MTQGSSNRPVELANHHLRLGTKVIGIPFDKGLACPQNDSLAHVSSSESPKNDVLLPAARLSSTISTRTIVNWVKNTPNPHHRVLATPENSSYHCAKKL